MRLLLRYATQKMDPLCLPSPSRNKGTEHRAIRASSSGMDDLKSSVAPRRRRSRRDGRPGVEEDGVVQFLVPLGAVGGVVAVVAEKLIAGA